jgi:uncharacterized protein (TIGR02246 family)
MEDEIRSASHGLADALARGDAGDAAALYTDDGKLLAPSAKLIAGRAEIEEYWRAGIALGLTHVELEPTGFELAGDVAIELGRYVVAIGDDRDGGKYVVLHRRQADGAWRRAVDVFNPDAPGTGRPERKEER